MKKFLELSGGETGSLGKLVLMGQEVLPELSAAIGNERFNLSALEEAVLFCSAPSSW